MQSRGPAGWGRLSRTWEHTVSEVVTGVTVEPDTVKGRTFALVAPLGDVVAAHLRVQRGPAKAEDGCCRLLVPPRRFERPHYRETLDLHEGPGRRDGSQERRTGVESVGQVGRRHLPPAGHQYGALNDVLELPHV